jgi:hypothetical protein
MAEIVAVVPSDRLQLPDVLAVQARLGQFADPRRPQMLSQASVAEPLFVPTRVGAARTKVRSFMRRSHISSSAHMSAE